MHSSFLPLLACPVCRGSLQNPKAPALSVPAALLWSGSLRCAGCSLSFPVEEGIPRLLEPSRVAEVSAFLAAYGRVRQREGWAVESADYYRNLPFQDVSGKHAAEWSARTFSFGRLLAKLSAHAKGRGLRVLDLGAGCGWLAARLAESGHHALAIDLDPGPHGLGAARHIRSDDAFFARVQGDLRGLPVADASADVVVLNASLHYAQDPGAVLRDVRRVLVPGGALAVIDSPTYPSEAERQRAAEASARYYASQGEPELARSYRGLVRGEVAAALEGFDSVDEETTRPVAWWRAAAGKLRRGYTPAYFSLFWARRTDPAQTARIR
jgi:SAM-dependent methyltransferase